ncbi:MAG: Hsp20/alpha crystallin family protein [Deltaproteobacteria bacterium]|nr:Hsp20/alpha crystallin family protein [Deltaproteobacteria bacterium]
MPSWDPFRELERLRSEMDRIFENVLPAGTQRLSFLPGLGARQYPRVNVAEDGNDYLVEALAPGVDPSTLDVSIKEGVLTLSGEKKAPEGVKADAYHRSERSAGRFVRSVELPAEIDAEKVKASYVDGILQVRLPKAERAKPKRVEISVA